MGLRDVRREEAIWARQGDGGLELREDLVRVGVRVRVRVRVRVSLSLRLRVWVRLVLG